MPTVIIDGHEIEIPAGRAAQRHRGRRAGRHRDPALLLASGPVGRGQLPHVPGRDRHARRRRPAQITMQPKLVPACKTPATDSTVFVTNSEKVAAGPGDGRRGPAAAASDRLPDLRQGGRVPACRTTTSSYGQDERRADLRPFTSRRRDIGDVTLFVDRCIMCSRCVRFTRARSAAPAS